LLKLITDNEQKSSHLNELQEEYGKLKEKLQSKRKEVVDMARWEAQKLLSDTNQQIENTIRIIREHGAKKEPTMKARKQLDQFKESVNTAADKSQQKIVPQNQPKPAEVTAVPIKASEILPGTKVKNKMSDQEGEVIEVKKNKVQVAFGLLKMWVPIEELQMSRSVAGNSKQKAKVGFNWVERQATFSVELDLRGVRGDEAVLKLQKWMDEAYALGQGTLKIIHGRGDGILKKLLRQHLKTINFVKRYYDEHADRGGDGCTYVELM
jgi:DNA mismatch repair protein MutS2